MVPRAGQSRSAQLRTAARFDGGVTSRGDATPENIHILLPPHGLVCVKGNILQFHRIYPHWRFINVVRIYTAFAWRNKAFGHDPHVPSGKAG